MRSPILVGIVLLVGASGAATAQERASGGAASGRHDIEAALPSDWRVVQARGGSARRYVSPDGGSWLAIEAQPARRETISSHMASVAQRAGEQVTYLRSGRGWIVASGYRGERIFYRKAMLACGNRAWHEISFEYPAARKRAFDRLVTQVSAAVKAYRDDGCEPES